MVPPGLEPAGEDLVQLRGLSGEHVGTFMEIPACGGLRDAGAPGQRGDLGFLAEPPQHHHRLNVDGGRLLPRPTVGVLAVGGQNAAGKGQGVLGLCRAWHKRKSRGDLLRG